MNARHVFRRRNGEFTHHRAIRITDTQHRVRNRLLQAQLQHRFRGRILAGEELMSPEFVVAVVLGLPLQRRSRREQRSVGLQRRAKLLDRFEVIQNPERATVRGHQQRVVARMNRELVHAHRGKVGLQALPRLAAIEREKDARFGAHIQHIGIARVFCERAHHFALQPRRNRTERRAVVSAHPHIRIVVVQPIVGDGDVHRARLEARRHDFRHERMTRGKTRQVFRNGLPGRAVVLRHTHRAVVGAGVEHAVLLRRLGE